MERVILCNRVRNRNNKRRKIKVNKQMKVKVKSNKIHKINK